VLKRPVGRQHKESLAVSVEATGGVDPRNVDEGGQGLPGASGFRGELAENPVGLVEQQGLQGWISDRGSGAFPIPPEVHHPDGDQQQTQVHRDGRQDHRAGTAENADLIPRALCLRSPIVREISKHDQATAA
jgi:hypothetical protein